MKKKAWTMLELTITLTIIVVLSIAGMNLYKVDINKSKIFIYITIKNLSKDMEKLRQILCRH